MFFLPDMTVVFKYICTHGFINQQLIFDSEARRPELMLQALVLQAFSSLWGFVE
jgi:hypothetical protein